MKLTAASALLLLALPASAKAAPHDLPQTLSDGRVLNLWCDGRRGPVLLFDSGWAADSRVWRRVMAGLPPRFRACAVDRAGEGRSSPGPTPRDGVAVARDLKGALERAALPAPYILVGHSLGALNMRHFQQLFPADVAAMVLVDPTVPGGGIPPQAARARACIAALAAPEGADPALVTRCRGKLPDGARARWESRLSELESLGASTAVGLAGQQPGSLSLPVIVLSAGGTFPDPAAGQAWTAAHARLASLSARGEARLVADSGHMMMLDRPEAIVAAVESVAPAQGERGNR